MKSLCISFAAVNLVLLCSGQQRATDYGRRRIIPKPQIFHAGSSSRTPFLASQSGSLETYQPGSAIPAGSGSTLTAASPGAGFPSDTSADVPFEQLPQWVRDLDGSTISGRPLVGGVGALPMHGGLGNDGDYSDGTRDGYGRDRHAPLPQSLSDWAPPSNLPPEILAQISAANSQSGSQGSVGQVDQSITGSFSSGNVPFTSTGHERQRVDSFVLDNLSPHPGTGPLQGIANVPDLGTIGSQSGSGPLQGIVNMRDMGTFRSPSFNPSTSSTGLQQVGVGIPRTDSSGFIGISAGDRTDSTLPGISGISGSGPLPAVGLDIYGRRQGGPLRPKRSTRL